MFLKCKSSNFRTCSICRKLVQQINIFCQDFFTGLIIKQKNRPSACRIRLWRKSKSNVTTLKWQCHDIFWQFFLLKRFDLGLNKQKKRFCELFRFRENIRILSSKNSTPRSVSLRGVTYFLYISAKTSLSAKPF